MDATDPKDNEEAQDRLIDVLLREELGGEAPPNLALRILKAASEPQKPAAKTFSVNAAKPARWKWPAAIAATVALAVLCGLLIANRRTQEQKFSGTAPEPAPPAKTVATGAMQRGAVLSTTTEARSFELGGYCHVQMQPRTELRVEGEEKAERIYLSRGTVECEVDKAVGSFAVQSEMGTVVVTGTKFRVRVPEAKGGANMSAKQMFVRVAVGAVLLSGAWGSLPLSAGEEGGAVTGIVASKSETWLSIKADGSDEAAMYMPFWRGGQPKDGGGFDKEMLGVIKSVAVGSKVKLVWKLEEHPRIVSLEVLAAPERKIEVASAERKHGEKREGEKMRDGEHREGEKVRKGEGEHREGEKVRKGDGEHREGEKPRKGDGEKMREDGDRPRKGEGEKKREGGHEEGKSGVAIGKVVSRGEGFVEIKPEHGDVEKYVPRWIGGLPHDGGGPDKDMIRQMLRLKVGEWVKIEWTADERRRAVKIHTKRE